MATPRLQVIALMSRVGGMPATLAPGGAGGSSGPARVGQRAGPSRRACPAALRGPRRRRRARARVGAVMGDRNATRVWR